MKYLGGHFSSHKLPNVWSAISEKKCQIRPYENEKRRKIREGAETICVPKLYQGNILKSIVYDEISTAILTCSMYHEVRP